jgi:predicted DNA-binding protein
MAPKKAAPKALRGTLTVRLNAQSLRRLRQQAKRLGTSPSDLVREWIELQVGPVREVSALELSRQWVGAVRSANIPPGERAREALATWEPDRR